MLAKADWNTVRRIPWVEKTAMIMCDLLDVDSHELIPVAPRSILQHQVDAATAMGFLRSAIWTKHWPRACSSPPRKPSRKRPDPGSAL